MKKQRRSRARRPEDRKIRWLGRGLDPLVRFMASVQPDLNSGCWLWEGTLTGRDGRATIKIGKKNVGAARFIYERRYGPMPEGRLACHKCDTPACVNPDHLYAGTLSDNIVDRKGRWIPWKAQALEASQ